MQLQDYDFNIVYRPGKDNKIADSLSGQGWENKNIFLKEGEMW